MGGKFGLAGRWNGGRAPGLGTLDVSRRADFIGAVGRELRVQSGAMRAQSKTWRIYDPSNSGGFKREDRQDRKGGAEQEENLNIEVTKDADKNN
jgi:hypothetical protein